MRTIRLFSFAIVLLPLLANAQKTYTFQECLEKTLANNISIQQGEEQLYIAEITSSQTKYNLLPSLNANANGANSFGYSVDPFTNQFTNESIRSTNYSLSLNWQIFSAFQRWSNYKKSKIDYQKSEKDLEAAQNDIIMLLANAYLQVLVTQEALKSSEIRVKNLELQLENTKKLVAAGKLPEMNIYDIEAQKSLEEFNFTNSNSQLDKAKLQLAQIMLETDLNFNVSTPNIILPENISNLPTDEVVFEAASKNFPKILSAELNVVSNEAGLKVSKSSYFPSLSFGAVLFTGTSSARKNYEVTGYELIPIGIVDGSQQIVYGSNPIITTSPNPFSNQLNQNLRQQLSLNLSIPLFNGMAVRTNVARSSAQLNIANLTLKSTQNQLRNDIQNARLEVMNSFKSYESAKKQFEATEKAFSNAKIRFENGMLNSLDYNNTLNNFTKAESDLRQSKYRFIFNQKILDFYMGNEITF